MSYLAPAAYYCFDAIVVKKHKKNKDTHRVRPATPPRHVPAAGRWRHAADAPPPPRACTHARWPAAVAVAQVIWFDFNRQQICSIDKERISKQVCPRAADEDDVPTRMRLCCRRRCRQAPASRLGCGTTAVLDARLRRAADVGTRPPAASLASRRGTPRSPFSDCASARARPSFSSPT